MEWKKGKKEGRKDDGWVVGTPILLGHQLITVMVGQHGGMPTIPPSLHLMLPGAIYEQVYTIWGGSQLGLKFQLRPS